MWDLAGTGAEGDIASVPLLLQQDVVGAHPSAGHTPVSWNGWEMQMGFCSHYLCFQTTRVLIQLNYKGGKYAQVNNFQAEHGVEQQRMPLTQQAQLFETFN